MNQKISKEQAKELLWQQGILTWKLQPVQKELYQSYKDCKEKVIVWNASRRLGKSYCLSVLALETCLRQKNALVKYCCAKQKDARNIIRPLILEIIEDCPEDLRPEYKTQEGAWVFKNGSRIELVGLDGGRAESVRGGSCHLVIIDEAGFVGDLPYIVGSILLPTTSTTGGKIIMSSTPPKSPDHPFITRYLNKARIEGNLVTKTIYDNKNISSEEFNKLVEEYGGVDATEFRREFLCIVEKDNNYAIIPEFNQVLKEKIVKEWDRSPFYDAYVSMDVGMKDLTAVLFAWYDFLNHKVVIENEFAINGQKFNTSTLAQGIKDKEKETFTDKLTGETKTPYLRVSDNNLIVIKDLWDLHGLRFMPTQKDDKDAAINKLRVMLENEQIIINPRCINLINHLENGVWNKNKTSFDRFADGSHADFVDSITYLVRNVQLSKNPFPSHFFNNNNSNKFHYNTKSKDAHNKEFSKIFGINKNVSTSEEKSKQLIDILTPKKFK